MCFWGSEFITPQKTHQTSGNASTRLKYFDFCAQDGEAPSGEGEFHGAARCSLWITLPAALCGFGVGERGFGSPERSREGRAVTESCCGGLGAAGGRKRAGKRSEEAEPGERGWWSEAVKGDVDGSREGRG